MLTLTTHPGASVYASPGWALSPAVCRFDLLESRPGARDRMHWHPTISVVHGPDGLAVR